jgi:hypothetical protein
MPVTHTLAYFVGDFVTYKETGPHLYYIFFLKHSQNWEANHIKKLLQMNSISFNLDRLLLYCNISDCTETLYPTKGCVILI